MPPTWVLSVAKFVSASTPALSAKVLPRLIGGDAPQPSAEGRSLMEGCNLAIDLEKHLLCNVGGILPSNHAHHQPVYAAVRQRIEPTLSFRIIALTRNDQCPRRFSVARFLAQMLFSFLRCRQWSVSSPIGWPRPGGREDAAGTNCTNSIVAWALYLRERQWMRFQLARPSRGSSAWTARPTRPVILVVEHFFQGPDHARRNYSSGASNPGER